MVPQSTMTWVDLPHWYELLHSNAFRTCQAIVKQSGSLAPESPEFLDRSYYVRNVYDKD